MASQPKFSNAESLKFAGKEQPETAGYTVLSYEIYECPQCPTDNGTYYGKTPMLEQAETVVRKAKEHGQMLFVKAVCSDGKKRYM